MAPMKIILLSSTNFGRQCLVEGIIPLAQVEMSGIMTTPNRIEFAKSNRPMQIYNHACFDELANELDSELIVLNQAPRAKDYLSAIERLQPDIMLVLGWYYLIPSSVLTAPPLGTVAIHASLLPRYRGMAPINWAIINGETQSGVTLFYLSKGVDDGDIIGQRSYPIADDDDCATVYDKATTRSISLLKQYLPLLAAGKAPRIKQDHTLATKYPRRTPEDGRINWTLSTKRVYDSIRAQTRPYPGAFTILENQKVIIWKALCQIDESIGLTQPGRIVICDKQVKIATGDGWIVPLECQLEDQPERTDSLAIFGSAQASIV